MKKANEKFNFEKMSSKLNHVNKKSKTIHNENVGHSKLSQFVHSIRFRLTITYVIPILFIIVLGITAYGRASKSIVSSFTNATTNAINSTANYYGSIMQSIENKAYQLTVDTNVNTYYSKSYTSDEGQDDQYIKAIKNYLTIAVSDKYMGNAAIFSKYGTPVAAKGNFKSSKPYFDYVKSKETSASNSSSSNIRWSGYHKYIDDQLGINPNDYSISLIRAYYGKELNTSPIGYIVMDISMETTSHVLSNISLPKGSTVAFISADGREITPYGSVNNNSFVGNSFYKDCIKAKTAYGHNTVNNKKDMFIYSKINDTGAMVCALIPYSSITSQANSIKYLTITIVLIAFIITVLFGLFITLAIGRSIKAITGTLSQAANGDLSVSIQENKKDEFQIIYDSLNHMINNMKELILKTLKVTDKVIISSKNVMDNSGLLLNASKNISTAINEVQQGITQQATDTENCLKQTDELANQINLVYDNSLAIERITANTKDVIKNGLGEVDQLNNAAKDNIQITNNTIRDIKDLEEESKSITAIIAVINDIAEQTNLLSLNASIEAARAGDAGRGFAVVADEIRNLSEKSVKSASEIENIINKIVSKTRNTVSTVNQAQNISQKTEERLLNVIQLFQNIDTHVDDLAQKLSLITEEITGIDKAKNDTLNAIESISAVAEETSASSEEVDATAQQQLESVTELNNEAKALKLNIEDLINTIQLFKTT